MRNAADSNLRAISVASIDAGGSRQLSQLPQRSGGSSPKCLRRIARRQSVALDQRGERVQPLAFAGAAVWLDFSLDPLPGARKVFRAPKQPGLGGVAIASGAPGFLVIGLDRFWDARVGDEADVGLVDAHPERNGRRNHHLLGLDKRRLVARPYLRLEAGMIGHGRAATRGQLLGGSLRLVAARRVDDPGSGLLCEEGLELACEIPSRGRTL